MNSARLSFGRKKCEEDLASSESEDESSSSSSSSSGSSSSSSSSRLSSSASSPANSDDETEPKKSSVTPSTTQSRVKGQSSSSASTSKSNESLKTKATPPSDSSSEPTVKTSRSNEAEVKQDDKVVKKYSKLTESDSDGREAKKSKIPSYETQPKKITTAEEELPNLSSKKSIAKKVTDVEEAEREKPKGSLGKVETKSEELPNLSAKKSIAKKATDVEEAEREKPKGSSGKVETKSEELPNLSSKKSIAKKTSEVEETEREKPKESSEKPLKISGIKEKIPKVSTADEGKASKEKPETEIKETPEKNSKETSGKVSKLSGSLKKFENLAEEKRGKEDSTRKPIEKLTASKLKKTSTSTNDEEARKEKASDGFISASKKNPVSERTSDEHSVDPEKISKIPKVKKSNERDFADEKDIQNDSTEKPTKLSRAEKEKKSKETIEDDKVEKPPEKVGKKSKISSAENNVTEDVDKRIEVSTSVSLTPEINSTKETVKKRKKSPAKDAGETVEMEDEKTKSESLVADLKKPSVEEKPGKEPATSSNRTLSAGDREESEAPVKTKKGSKRSSKSPTPIAGDKTSPEVLENVGKSSSDGVDLANTREDPAVAVKKIFSIKPEETILKPSEEKLSDSVSLVENLALAGQTVVKETVAKDYNTTLHVKEKINLAGEVDNAEKKNAATIKVLSDGQELSIIDLKPEISEKPTCEKTPDEVEIAVPQKNNESEKHPTEEVSFPLKSEITEDLSGGGGGETSKETEDGELKSTNDKESVDDFIQRILSEVRSSDQRIKDLAKERAETESEAAGDQNEEPSKEVKTKSSAKEEPNENQATGKPPIAIKSPGHEEPTDRNTGEMKQRIRSPDEDEELAILAKYFGKKGLPRPGADFQDPDASEELDNRAVNSAEIMRRRRQDDEYEIEGGSDFAPPYARTMAGPKVSKRNLQRYNFGDSDSNGREEGFVSRFRRERHGGVLPDETFLPRRSEETSEVVRQKCRGVRTLVESQTEVVDAVKKASKGLDELEKEIMSVKQLSLGRRAHADALESAFDAEVRTYENEYRTAAESHRQRTVQSGHEKKKDFMSIMFGPKQTFVDPGVDAISTPAVASFMNIYGSSGTQRGSEMVNGVLDQRPSSRDFGFESDVKVRTKVDDYLSAPDRRIETTRRKENGREVDTSASFTGYSPTVSGIDVGASASDEFLSRVLSKYPILSSSSPAEPAGSSRLADFTSVSGFLGPPSNGQLSSRGLTRGSSSGYANGAFAPPDSSSSWRERGTTSTRRSAHFGDESGGLGSGGDTNWRRSAGGSESYIGRSLSIGSRTRRS